ncbi:transposase [Nocardia sp. GAS34]
MSRFGGPAGIAKAGRKRVTTVAVRHAPRIGTRLAADIFDALDAQTVTVPGTAAADIVLPRLADSLKSVVQQRKDIAADVERMLDAHPLAKVLTSMPGVGVRTGARILLEIGDVSAFASPGHLAAYAGIAPVTHRSGTSIAGEHLSRSGNRKLERALFLSAFASLSDPASRAYYTRKRSEGKRHNAALICLSRRRCDVLYAMLENKQPYRSPAARPA